MHLRHACFKMKCVSGTICFDLKFKSSKSFQTHLEGVAKQTKLSQFSHFLYVF
jgi:hypothetical protein